MTTKKRRADAERIPSESDDAIVGRLRAGDKVSFDMEGNAWLSAKRVGDKGLLLKLPLDQPKHHLTAILDGSELTLLIADESQKQGTRSRHVWKGKVAFDDLALGIEEIGSEFECVVARELVPHLRVARPDDLAERPLLVGVPFMVSPDESLLRFQSRKKGWRMDGEKLNERARVVDIYEYLDWHQGTCALALAKRDGLLVAPWLVFSNEDAHVVVLVRVSMFGAVLRVGQWLVNRMPVLNELLGEDGMEVGAIKEMAQKSARFTYLYPEAMLRSGIIRDPFATK